MTVDWLFSLIHIITLVILVVSPKIDIVMNINLLEDKLSNI